MTLVCELPGVLQDINNKNELINYGEAWRKLHAKVPPPLNPDLVSSTTPTLTASKSGKRSGTTGLLRSATNSPSELLAASRFLHHTTSEPVLVKTSPRDNDPTKRASGTLDDDDTGKVSITASYLPHMIAQRVRSQSHPTTYRGAASRRRRPPLTSEKAKLEQNIENSPKSDSYESDSDHGPVIVEDENTWGSEAYDLPLSTLFPPHSAQMSVARRVPDTRVPNHLHRVSEGLPSASARQRDEEELKLLEQKKANAKNEREKELESQQLFILRQLQQVQEQQRLLMQQFQDLQVAYQHEFHAHLQLPNNSPLPNLPPLVLPQALGKKFPHIVVGSNSSHTPAGSRSAVPPYTLEEIAPKLAYPIMKAHHAPLPRPTLHPVFVVPTKEARQKNSERTHSKKNSGSNPVSPHGRPSMDMGSVRRKSSAADEGEGDSKREQSPISDDEAYIMSGGVLMKAGAHAQTSMHTNATQAEMARAGGHPTAQALAQMTPAQQQQWAIQQRQYQQQQQQQWMVTQQAGAQGPAGANAGYFPVQPGYHPSMVGGARQYQGQGQQQQQMAQAAVAQQQAAAAAAHLAQQQAAAAAAQQAAAAAAQQQYNGRARLVFFMQHNEGPIPTVHKEMSHNYAPRESGLSRLFAIVEVYVFVPHRKKPLVLRVPQTTNFGQLSAVAIKTRNSTPKLPPHRRLEENPEAYYVRIAGRNGQPDERYPGVLSKRNGNIESWLRFAFCLVENPEYKARMAVPPQEQKVHLTVFLPSGSYNVLLVDANTKMKKVLQMICAKRQLTAANFMLMVETMSYESDSQSESDVGEVEWQSIPGSVRVGDLESTAVTLVQKTGVATLQGEEAWYTGFAAQQKTYSHIIFLKKKGLSSNSKEKSASLDIDSDAITVTVIRKKRQPKTFKLSFENIIAVHQSEVKPTKFHIETSDHRNFIFEAPNPVMAKEIIFRIQFLIDMESEARAIAMANPV